MPAGAFVEPLYLEDKRPDIHAFFSDARFMLDVCVAHPSAPSRVRLAALHLSIARMVRFLLMDL